jgi:hypothetical protein
VALSSIPHVLTYLEPALWLCVLAAYLRLRKQLKLTMLSAFLAVKLVSSAALLWIRNTTAFNNHSYTGADSFAYWISYFAGCVLLFFALQEIFRYTMTSLPGLSRLGIICFRWAAAVSLVIAFASIVTSLPLIAQNISVSFICTEIATCLCVLELCLLAFLLVCVHSLKHTFRSRVFGLCTGLGMMAATDMVVFTLRYSGVYTVLTQFAEFATIAALLVIVTYLVLPEPAPKHASLSVASSLLRWNDLALALGQNAETAATGQQNGFLQDVEGVVDRVLAKNSMNNAAS